MSRSLKFPKSARLHHRTLVNALFDKGQALYEYPLRLVWRTMDEEALQSSFRAGKPQGIDRMQMLVTIPKRKQKRAVDRVLLRRRVREAYRLQRLPLLEEVAKKEGIATLSLAFIYLSDKVYPYAEIEVRMRSLLDKLASKL